MSREFAIHLSASQAKVEERPNTGCLRLRGEHTSGCPRSFAAHAAALDYSDLQTGFREFERNRAADHASPDDYRVLVHFSSMLAGAKRTPRVMR
jgi:hypothetical protein